jgi:hypothetical protein
MSARPISINDEVPVPIRIRRDQFRRIRSIIEANRQFPQIALGLVRDYAKGVSDISLIKFDNEENPTEICVYTRSTRDMHSTEYHYRLQIPAPIETPTLG